MGSAARHRPPALITSRRHRRQSDRSHGDRDRYVTTAGVGMDVDSNLLDFALSAELPRQLGTMSAVGLHNETFLGYLMQVTEAINEPHSRTHSSLRSMEGT